MDYQRLRDQNSKFGKFNMADGRRLKQEAQLMLTKARRV